MRSSATRHASCAGCDAPPAADQTWCGRCGRRRSFGSERATLALDGVVAVTDRGHRRRRNEDAVAIGVTGTALVAVVCDGISHSAHPDAAANAAVDAAVAELLSALAAGATPAGATHAAFAVAMSAVTAIATVADRDSPPATTYVSGVLTADSVTVGWAGDSPAYWLPEGGEAVRLTVDDCLAGRLAASGVRLDVDLGPEATALTRWLGADAGPVTAELATVDGPAHGTLVLCSDGLSRYVTTPASLASHTAGGPGAAADRLTRLALDAGGVDNVTVAVLDRRFIT